MDKLAYTKIFIKESGEAINDINIQLKLHILWKNVRKNSNSLRLSDKGLRFITEKLNLKVFEIPFPVDLDLKANVLIYLDRFIDCPYHLSDRAITVLNEKKAMELHLFSGDVRKYGLTKAMKREIPSKFKTF